MYGCPDRGVARRPGARKMRVEVGCRRTRCPLMAPDLLGCRVGSPVSHGQKDAHRISAHESQKTALMVSVS